MSTRALAADEFLTESGQCLIVDVRSPAEYSRGHIPGSVNIPLFDNDERARVGIAYKQQSREDAILKGMEIAGPKMSGYVRELSSLGRNGKIMVYCWRGGMRSASMAWLFSTAGFDSCTLEGGYRAYRRHLKASFAREKHLIIIGGMTGSGKTSILKEIRSQGIQSIDLEEIACHRGSAFGSLGQPPQPTTEQFENNLFVPWMKLNSSQPVLLEDESQSVGRVNLPVELYKRMREAPIVALEVPREVRVNRLVEEYAGFDKQALANALARIGKRLGGDNLRKALLCLEKNDFHTVAHISLNYYDKAYLHGLSGRAPAKLYPLPVSGTDVRADADILFKFIMNHLIS